MNNELMADDINKVELEKIEKIKSSHDALVNKTSKILFCIPESQTPVASVYELYRHATIMKKIGFEVIVLTEKGDYTPPTWIETELTNHTHLSMADSKLTVSPDTIMIIPEVYSNIMEQTKNLPCLRVGFLQSIDYMLNALIPGTDWSSFGIRDIITTSQTLKELIQIYFNNKFNINVCDLGIPDYFKKADLPQKPIISIIGRNPNEISKLVKLFYSKYPQYNWVTFDPMLTNSKPPQPMRRIDFAERLKNNFAAVWVDRIASLGTFPLECMKSGVVPICLKPDIIPDYMIERDENGKPIKAIENAGIWTENFYDLPMLIGETLTKFIDDNLPNEIYGSMDNVITKYSDKISEESIIKTYENIINDRIKLFDEVINLSNNK